MNILTKLANKYELDKGTLDPKNTTWYLKYPDHDTLGYTEIYAMYMESVRDATKKILEIGIYDLRFPGASLKMWYEYFYNAEIWGIDNFWGNIITDEILYKLTNERTHIYVADQSNRKEMYKMFEIAGSDFDFIIEDGAHWPSHIMISLVSCFTHLKSGGIYFIEDLQNPISAGHAAYDNLQITNIFKEYIETGNLKRLYITKKEHEYLLQNIKSITMFPLKQQFLVAIEKK